MTVGIFGPALAYDHASKRGVAGVVCKVLDAVTGIPLEALKIDGTASPLISNSQGYVPEFTLDPAPLLVIVEAGALRMPMMNLSMVMDSSQAAIDAVQAAQDAAALVEAPADTVIKTLVAGESSQTRGALEAVFQKILPLVTTATDGIMRKADKEKIDGATSSPASSALVQRDIDSQFQVLGPPKSLNYVANKKYVDDLDTVPKLVYKSKLASAAPNTYPAGYSTGLFATGVDGWPTPGGFRQVVTFQPPGYSAGTVQWAYPYQRPNDPTLMRFAKDATTWDDAGWKEMATGARVDAAAEAAESQMLTRGKLSYVLTSHVSASPNFVYHVAKIRTYGKFVPGIVEKHFSRDYEKTYTSGAFSPVAIPLREHAVETGAVLVTNSSAWADAGNMTGCVIKDGVAYQDFATSPKGRHALGVLKTGEFRIYQQGSATAASMVADGVTDTFVYGPPLVRNGVKENLTSIIAEWSDLSLRRPRTILGQTASGDVLVIIIEGDRAPRLGASATECATLAVSLGMRNAIVLDGGGSSQGISSGAFFAFSSDATPRPVKESLNIHVPQGNANSDDSPVWYESDVTAGSGIIRRRLTNAGGEKRLILRGNITGITAINTTIVTLEKEFWPSDWIYETVPCITGGVAVMGTVVIKSNGDVQITRKDGTTWNAADRYDFNIEVAIN